MGTTRLCSWFSFYCYSNSNRDIPLKKGMQVTFPWKREIHAAAFPFPGNVACIPFSRECMMRVHRIPHLSFVNDSTILLHTSPQTWYCLKITAISSVRSCLISWIEKVRYLLVKQKKMMMQGDFDVLLNDLSLEDLTRTQGMSTYRVIKQMIPFWSFVL